MSQPPRVTIRPAAAGDLPAIADLYAELHAGQWTGEEAALQVSPERWLEEASAALFDPQTRLFVALDAGGAGEIVGSVRLEFGVRPVGPIAEIRRLVVTDQSRRRGIASRLMAAAEEAAAEAGVSDIRLTVMTGNEPARRLYERRGYRRFAIRYRRSSPG